MVLLLIVFDLAKILIVFDIATKDASGNTIYVKKSQCESEVKSILPKELSRYYC